MKLLFGTHTYDGRGDSARRQANGIASLRALTGVSLVNVQFQHGAHEAPGIETRPVLVSDGSAVTGRRGARKPIISEVFDAIATVAGEHGFEYFGFTNADILVTQAAVDRVHRADREAFLFSRMEFDPVTGADLEMCLPGVDVFVLTTRWWRDHRWRFRPYVAACGIWDTVYTAQALCHADGLLLNREPLVRHESHPMQEYPSPDYGDYMRMLAAFDAGYFSLWCDYWDRLTEARAAGASGEAEVALQREIFVWHPRLDDRIVQAARNLKARVRYRYQQLAV